MNPGYTTQPGSAARQIDYLEDWLVALVQQAKRTNELLERQGKPGSSTDAREESRIERLGKRLEQAVGNQLSYRLNQAQGLANRGFSGTVEAARMDYAMEQLGRQFAAVMKPVMDALTYGAVQIEARMRRMSGGDQNALLGMGLGAFAGRMMLGGLPGMLLGGAMGTRMLGGGSEASFGLGAAGGAAMGYRAFGVPGAIIGGTLGAIGSAETSYAGEGPGGYYSRMRDRGYTVAGASLSTAAAAIRGLIFGHESGTPPTGTGTRPAPRRDVTPFQSDMMEAGGTYFAIQKSMIRATAGAEFEEKDPLKPFIDLMLEVIGLLARIANVEFIDPRSATAAREREVRAAGGFTASAGGAAGSVR